LTRRAYAAPLAGFAATGDVTPLIVNPAIMPFHLCTGSFFTLSELMSLFRGSRLPRFLRAAGASSALRSRAGALERGLIGAVGFFGSARNEVRGRAHPTSELYLMDAVIEPEWLVQISLGQENPRMPMNAAPGSLVCSTAFRRNSHGPLRRFPPEGGTTNTPLPG